MDMRDAGLETPWPEEPSPLYKCRRVPSYCQRPPGYAKDLIQQETSWAQSMIQKHPNQNYPLP